MILSETNLKGITQKEEVENLIAAKKNEFLKTILELNTTQKDYTAESLKYKVDNPKALKTVSQVFLEYINCGASSLLI